MSVDWKCLQDRKTTLEDHYVLIFSTIECLHDLFHIFDHKFSHSPTGGENFIRSKYSHFEVSVTLYQFLVSVDWKWLQDRKTTLEDHYVIFLTIECLHDLFHIFDHKVSHSPTGGENFIRLKNSHYKVSVTLYHFLISVDWKCLQEREKNIRGSLCFTFLNY